MAELNFNASEAPARTPRVSTPLPAGIYTAEITSADVKPLKSGRGTGLSLEYTIIDPEEHANRKVWQHINVKHDSAQAEEIGLGELKELCDAIGIAILKESDELFGKIVRIQTKVRASQGDYSARAEVNGYMAAGAPAPKSAPAAPAAAAPKPWQRSAA
jgi:hypothetical protein